MITLNFLEKQIIWTCNLSYQVAPAEIESILLSHPAVLDAGVIGKPDELAGEVPAAFVVKHPSSKASAEEICQFVNGKFVSLLLKVMCILFHHEL